MTAGFAAIPSCVRRLVLEHFSKVYLKQSFLYCANLKFNNNLLIINKNVLTFAKLYDILYLREHEGRICSRGQ